MLTCHESNRGAPAGGATSRYPDSAQSTRSHSRGPAPPLRGYGSSQGSFPQLASKAGLFPARDKWKRLCYTVTASFLLGDTSVGFARMQWLLPSCSLLAMLSHVDSH